MRFKPLNGKIGAFLIALFIVGSLYAAMPKVRTATPIPGTSLTMTSPTIPREWISYGGCAGIHSTDGSGTWLAVRFTTPTGGDHKLFTARFNLYSYVYDFNVYILDSDGSTILFGPLNVYPPTNGWFDVDLSGDNIVVSGDFYITAESLGGYAEHYGPEIKDERDYSIALRSYRGSPEGWILYDDRDLCIEAEVEVKPKLTIVPTLTFPTPTISPGPTSTVPGTYTTTKTFTNSSTITWTETHTTTKTYTITTNIYETFTSYKTVLIPTFVLQVEIREVTDPRGRVSTTQVYVTKIVMIPYTEKHEVFETRITEIVEDTTITSPETFTETKYSKFILVETIKPEIEESETNYLLFLMIAIAAILVVAIVLARRRGKRAKVKGVCGGG